MSAKKIEMKQKIDDYSLQELLSDFFTTPDPLEKREYLHQFLTVVAHCDKSDHLYGDKSDHKWELSPNVKSWSCQILCDGTTYMEYYVGVYVEYHEAVNNYLGERFDLYQGPSASTALMCYKLFNMFPTFEKRYQTHNFYEWIDLIKSKI